MEKIDELNGFILSVTDDRRRKKRYYVPVELLCLILSHVGFKDQFFACRLVCRSWKTAVEKISLRQKGEREYGFKAENCIITRGDANLNYAPYIYYLIYKKMIFGRNILRNNCGQEGLKYWEYDRRIHEKTFTVEEACNGAEMLPENCDDFEGRSTCFAISVNNFISPSKSQVINLSKTGITAKVMDKLQPVVRISEWFTNKASRPGSYDVEVSLLNGKKHVVKSFTERKMIDRPEKPSWVRVGHEFSNYGPGIRYISYRHGGYYDPELIPRADAAIGDGNEADGLIMNAGIMMAGGAVKLFYSPET